MVLGQAKMVFGAYAHESELASHPFRQSAAAEKATFSPTDAQETFVSSKSLQDGPNIGKAAVKGVAYGAVGAILGAGMSQGGIGGAVCGVLAGATLGMVTIGPMGDGNSRVGRADNSHALAVVASAGHRKPRASRCPHRTRSVPRRRRRRPSLGWAAPAGRSRRASPVCPGH